MLVKHRLARLDDWLHLNYHSFFVAILLFADLDYGRLGHLLRNQQSRLKNRSGGHGRSHKVSDRRDGLLDFLEHGRIKDSDYWSIQQYLDQRRNYVNVHSCVIELDNSYLLPSTPKARDTSHGICTIPISSSDLGPSHGHNFDFSTSKTTQSTTSTISTPISTPISTTISTPIPTPKSSSIPRHHSGHSNPPVRDYPRSRARGSDCP
jgi:hypothetical protein